MPTLNGPNDDDEASVRCVAAPNRPTATTVPVATPTIAGLPKIASMSRAAVVLASVAARGVAGSCRTVGA
jgi:hypothetical protein